MKQFGSYILTVLLLGTAVATGIDPASASITYDVALQNAGPLTLTGIITTDGSTGILAQSDIVDWNLLVTGDPVALTPANAPVFLVGSDLTATLTALSFNFGDNTGNGGVLEIASGPCVPCAIAEWESRWSSAGDPTGQFFLSESTSFGTGAFGQTFINDDVIIATSSVPEPSTWAMMIFGFAGIGFMAYRRKLKPALMAA